MDFFPGKPVYANIRGSIDLRGAVDVFETFPELIISTHLRLELLWLKTAQEDKEESLKADGLLRDKENLIGKQKSFKKAKQNMEVINIFPLAGRCSAMSRRAGPHHREQ